MRTANVLMILFFGAFIIITLWWANDHDQKVMQSAEKYEECVRSQYGVSPAFWYEEHGEYPECK